MFSEKSLNISRLIPASEVLRDMQKRLRDYFDDFLLFSLYNFVQHKKSIVFIDKKYFKIPEYPIFIHNNGL